MCVWGEEKRGEEHHTYSGVLKHNDVKIIKLHWNLNKMLNQNRHISHIEELISLTKCVAIVCNIQRLSLFIVIVVCTMEITLHSYDRES